MPMTAAIFARCCTGGQSDGAFLFSRRSACNSVIGLVPLYRRGGDLPRPDTSGRDQEIVEQVTSRAQGLVRCSVVPVACDLDLNAWPISGAINNRFRRCATATSLLRCTGAQGTVGTFCVVPCRKRVEPALNNPPFTGGAGYAKITPALRNSVVCLAVAGCLEA